MAGTRPRLTNAILPALIALINLSALVNGDCFMAKTSEGVRDLEEGQYACAPANWNNTHSDAGQYYHRCLSGVIHTWTCPGVLRWDLKNSICHWPSLASCQLPAPEPKVVAPKKVAPPEPVTCNEKTCKAPDCFCYGDVPKMDRAAIPQFIMLTFDDAITSSMFSSVYTDLLVRSPHRNPNNCPVKATFFLSHNYTDYRLVQFMYNLGHEMASHTINHTSHETDFKEVADEIIGQRNMISDLTTIPVEEIRGFRSPYLSIFGDVQYDVLDHYNMTWDSSITNVEISQGRSPLWPHTLDFVIERSRCPMGKCPTKSHPGVWEIPMNGWIGANGFSCGMIDGCSISGQNFTGEPIDYYNFFKKNFDTFYAEKVPMHMFTHASMFMKSPNSISGLQMFMQEVLSTHNDVWFVSPSQVVDWMKNPVSNDELLLGNDIFDCPKGAISFS